MLTGILPLIVVKQIKVPFEYRKVEGELHQYVKTYDCETPFTIPSIKETKLVSNSSILIYYNRKYYWCPLFEELYKAQPNKITITHTLKMEQKFKHRLAVIFKVKSKTFKTYEVIEIRERKNG